MNRLILGTAQFGSDYGIKRDGRPGERQIEKIARTAWDAGIRTIHWSAQYGLPEICNAIFSEFDLIAKDEKNPAEFFWYDRFGELMHDGISIYEKADLDGIEERKYDIIQIPISIVDGRLLGSLESLKERFREIHSRSVFLQGLLLMSEFPPWMNSHYESEQKIREFRMMCVLLNIEPYEAALGYVLGLNAIDRVIIGVNSEEQLEQLVKVEPWEWTFDSNIDDEEVLDPRRWPR